MVFTLEISQVMRVQSQLGRGAHFLIFHSLWPAWGTQLEGPFQTMEAVLSQQDPNYLWIPVNETPLSPKWKTGQSQTLVWFNQGLPLRWLALTLSSPPHNTLIGEKLAHVQVLFLYLSPGPQDLNQSIHGVHIWIPPPSFQKAIPDHPLPSHGCPRYKVSQLLKSAFC